MGRAIRFAPWCCRARTLEKTLKELGGKGSPEGGASMSVSVLL